MNPIFAAALELQAFCRERKWHFCFIGGVAVQRWGEPRLTVDADLTLLTGFGTEEPFVDALLAAFKSRRVDARDFALRYRVVLLESSNRVPLDISLGAMPFEERAIQRASAFIIGGEEAVLTCSAEDFQGLRRPRQGLAGHRRRHASTGGPTRRSSHLARARATRGVKAGAGRRDASPRTSRTSPRVLSLRRRASP